MFPLESEKGLKKSTKTKIKKMQGRGGRDMENLRINHIEKTNEVLTDIAELALFVKYLSGIGISSLINGYFGSMRKSKKGIPVDDIFK